MEQPDGPLRYDVTVLQSEITTEHTASLRISIANDSDEKVLIRSKDAAFFRYAPSVDEELFLVHPSGDREPTAVRASEGCWRAADYQNELAANPFYVEPGGTESATVYVFGHYQLSGSTCLPSGVHEFETETEEPLSGSGDGDPGVYEWGFTLTVQD